MPGGRITVATSPLSTWLSPHLLLQGCLRQTETPYCHAWVPLTRGWGVGGLSGAHGVKQPSLFWPLSRHTIPSVLPQSKDNDLSVTAASSHLSYSGQGWLIDWLSRALTSHYPQAFCSSVILQNISHLCCAHCISQSLAAHTHRGKHRGFSDRLWEML